MNVATMLFSVLHTMAGGGGKASSGEDEQRRATGIIHELCLFDGFPPHFHRNRHSAQPLPATAPSPPTPPTHLS